ncbi:MAG: hypothetical protein K1060chlam5_01084 [Candidatus Anoxychlamydiales bacterium]|nr:hypothetical protein [Candidatus Anoxychlamydiales bacterium]
MRNKKKIFYFFTLLFFLNSCSYHLGRNEDSKISTVSVPYVKGDFSGLFTQEVIRQISNTPSLTYRYSNADSKLKIAIIDNKVDQIGYKYDRDKKDQRKKNIRQTESRQTITVNIELMDNKTNETILGPYKISADEAFDYVDQDNLNDLSFVDSNGNRETVLAFSLGQLESFENAKDASLKPIYIQLAQKIVDAISSQW